MQPPERAIGLVALALFLFLRSSLREVVYGQILRLLDVSDVLRIPLVDSGCLELALRFRPRIAFSLLNWLLDYVRERLWNVLLCDRPRALLLQHDHLLLDLLRFRRRPALAGRHCLGLDAASFRSGAFGLSAALPRAGVRVVAAQVASRLGIRVVFSAVAAEAFLQFLSRKLVI